MREDDQGSATGAKVRPVLVVEDHDDSRQLLCDLLASADIPCVTATDGNAALLALRVHRPRVILLDLMMPEMDGRKFRQEQQQLADPELASVPIILLSARPDHDEYARALGAIATIRKPIDLDRLLGEIRKYFPAGPSNR
jgi:two-component system chemotaxis response regulator CheY